jgi:HAD superfamily phosphoserine phosphatase-like hydrolase
MKPHAISFFDLDHTLLKVNSSFRFGVYLYRRKMFSFLTMLYLTGCYGLHTLGYISIQKLQEKIFKKIFLGRPFLAVESLARSFLEQNFSRMLYLPAIGQLQLAKKEGHYTVILSSSPHFLVSLFAERFGVDEWDATHYAVDSAQHFSAISQFMLGEGKARYVTELAKRLNIPKEKISAYTDSHHDLPFLQSAGVAMGVNPNKRLRALCKQNNWQIL